MPLLCQPIADALAPHGLVAPELELLDPNNQNYRCLLMQAAGPIYADETRIGHHNRALANLRCRNFLQLALDRNAQLSVTPEYCLPWSVLQDCAIGALFPQQGQLWALGCESVTPDELAAFVVAVANHCKVVHEPLPDQGTYFDPLVFLFQTKTENGVLNRPGFRGGYLV